MWPAVSRCLTCKKCGGWTPRHSTRADFFHGAFEVITDQTGVVLFLGLDRSRPTAERARTFLEKYARRAWTVDLADLALPGIPEPYRGEVGPIVLGALASRIAQHFEAVTGHDLDMRRYMHKVEY